MTRKTPDKRLRGVPCSIVAVESALCGRSKDIPDMVDGYTTLDRANRYIRANLPVKKRLNFKRGERPRLKDLHLDGRAVVCVLGHFLYLDHEDYYSFFNNENNRVVTMWILGGA